MKKASTEDLRIFLMEVTDEIGSAHPETRDTKISARLLRDILTELLANREAQPVGFYTTVSGRKGVVWHNGAPEDDTAIYTAPPATVVNPEFTGATAVPDFKALAENLVENLVDCGGADEKAVEKYLAFAEKACRAAMLAQPVSQECKLPDNVREALTLALQAMEFMGDTLNNIDAVCTEDVEYVTPAFTAVRGLLAAAPEGGN